MIGSPDGLLLAIVLFLLALPVLSRWYHSFRTPGCVADTEEMASALLRDLLTEGERRQLVRCGYLVVHSPSAANRAYRVPAGRGRVDVYESGRLAMRLCVQPVDPLPAVDVLLVHKLMIEGSEQEYLRRANIEWMRAPLS